MADNRVTTICIAGREYPACFSVAAVAEVDERFGGVENIESALDANKPGEMVQNLCWLISTMVKQGVKREKVLKSLDGELYEGPQPIAYEDLMAILSFDDINPLVDMVTKTISAGTKVTVEVETEKNAITTQ